jgi:hypothetical protein
MKGNREAHFSAVLYLIRVGSPARKSAGYGILENCGISKFHNHTRNPLLETKKAEYKILRF